MLQEGIRGNKKSREEELQLMSDIQTLIPQKNDDEIMEILHIPNSTYYRYKSKIYKEAKKIWKQVCQESLEHRALLLKRTVDLRIKINEEIARDLKQPAKDRIEAAYEMCDAQLDLFKLLRDSQDWVLATKPSTQQELEANKGYRVKRHDTLK